MLIAKFVPVLLAATLVAADGHQASSARAAAEFLADDAQQGSSARAAADLLAADRTLGANAVTMWMPAALATMRAPDAIMPAPGVGFAEGREAILATLARDTANANSRLRWTPVRAGVSSDGTHGVTMGLLTVTRANAAVLEYKYLAYWVRAAEGWKAMVWRRVPRARGEVSMNAEAPWLPIAGAAGAAPLTATALETARRELMEMERIFSDSAARIGIGPAFEAMGARDAMHLGGPNDADFNRGNRVIARAVQGDGPATESPLTWSAERTLISPSGDLGVNLGYIVPNAAAPNGTRPRIPFFTVWRREAGGWKYIAE